MTILLESLNELFYNNNLAELDNVARLVGTVAVAGEGGTVIVVSVGVGIRAGLLEDGRVVDLPVSGLARLGLVVGSSAAVLVGVEGKAC